MGNAGDRWKADRTRHFFFTVQIRTAKQHGISVVNVFFCIPAIHQNKAPMIRLPEIFNLFNCKILAAGHPKKLETQNNA